MEGEVTGEKTAKRVFDLTPFVDDPKDVDLEAITRVSDSMYLLASENKSKILEWNGTEARTVLAKTKKQLKKMGFNKIFGMETLCLFKKGDKRTLVIGKEKEPVMLVAAKYPEEDHRIETLEIPEEMKELDINDCVQRGDDLLLLNRSGYRVFVAGIKHGVVSIRESWDFSWIKKDPRFDYWTRDQVTKVQHDEWGIAEALATDGEFLYIGLDNNGQPLHTNPNETRPAFLKFRIPK
jgi:hypothetical protein